ncbi:MAG: L,D-transpeptidase family protein [Rhodocyclaceae bacterium]|nr:L,D-transpeptidase family protein [Rhodocyclaceae bacterium]
MKTLARAALLWLGFVLGQALAADKSLPRYTDAGPEPLLARVFEYIEKSHWEAALQETEKLLAAYPNFRLAHLIKGDLLLARTRPLSRFGEGGEAADAAKVNDLREEAIARLRAYREKPRQDAVPRYLLQLSANQQYAIVIDTERSRLYLYRNDQGTPRFVADYYVSHGKLGTEKMREGDKKTPIGVYRVIASIPRQKLSDFYGSGAFPLDYPNAWDKKKGRNGHGIWLHGTPADTFARPPKASDGCVVLANPDLEELARHLQIGATPVIISNRVEWLSLDDWRNERQALLAMIEEWRKDWESLDLDRYARHYAREFSSGTMDRSAWLAHKSRVNASKQWIKIGIDNISMFRNPGKEEYVVVTFEQDYRSSNLSQRTQKRQYWIKEEGRWKILQEETL